MRIMLAGICLLLTHNVLAVGQEPEFRPFRAVRRPGAFKPIKNFPTVAASRTDLADNELVLGVVVDDVARAYPINMLTGPTREILNDTLAGHAIAATW